MQTKGKQLVFPLVPAEPDESDMQKVHKMSG